MVQKGRIIGNKILKYLPKLSKPTNHLRFWKRKQRLNAVVFCLYLRTVLTVSKGQSSP